MRWAALLGVLVLACGGGGKHRRGDGDDLSGRPVKSVKVDGNHAFSDEDIVEGLEHHRPEGLFNGKRARYDRLALAVDRKRVVSFYRERGYFTAAVRDVKVDRAGGGVAIRFQVEEGKASIIEEVEVKGVPARAQRATFELLAEAGIARGRPFRHNRYLEAKESLERQLFTTGFAHARVGGEVRVDRDRHRAEVHIEVDAGPLARFGPAKIEGEGEIPVEAIRARFAWSEGDRFDPRQLEETSLRLRELNLSSITVDIERAGRPEVVSPLIRASTGRPRELKLGGGALWASPRFQVRTRADYTHRGIFHPLLTFRAEARVGAILVPRRQELIELKASLQRNDFLVPLLQLTGTVAPFTIEDYEAYTTIGSGGGLRIARPFFRHRLRLSAGWGVNYYDIDPRDQRIAQQLAVSDTQAIAYYEQSATLDLRDDRINPREGLLAELRAEEGGPSAGGRLRYLRATGDLRGYLPLGDRLVLAARIRAGRLSPKGDEDPLTRRFFGGGSNSHRGFGFRQLSPTVANEKGGRVPVGGVSLLLSSIEARFRLTKLWDLPLTSTLFFDAGDVTSESEEIEPSNLHHAAGLGFRLETPVGALRLDVALRLNRLGLREPDGRVNPKPGQRFVVHLAIGEAF